MQLSPGQLDNARLFFTPACRLIASEWAVVELWQAHQSSEETTFPTDMACRQLPLIK